MAFKFNVKPMATEPMDMIDLLQAQEELNQAFMDLTDAQKNMTEVCEVMENIQTSVDLITKYGAAGVEQLNMDGSLEALLQVPAKLITAEKAQEGLGEAAKAAWEKFKEWCLKAWEFIRGIFAKVLTFVTNAFNSAKEKIAIVKSASKEAIDKAGEIKVNSNAATEALQDWFKPTTLYPADMIIDVLHDYTNVIKTFAVMVKTYDPAQMISEFVDEVIKVGDSNRTEEIAANFLDTKVKTFINDITKNHGSLAFKVRYDQNDRGRFPTPMIEFYSDKLKGYSPVETTYRALGWAGNEGNVLIDFFELWGDAQRSIGIITAEVNASRNKISTAVDAAEAKVREVEVGFGSWASKVGVLSLAIAKTCLDVGLREVDILKETAKELQPMITALTTK